MRDFGISLYNIEFYKMLKKNFLFETPILIVIFCKKNSILLKQLFEICLWTHPDLNK